MSAVYAFHADHVTIARNGLRYLVHRMLADPRLAYLIGPGSECFDQVTAGLAALEGRPPHDLREQLTRDLKIQRVPPIGDGSTEVDFEDRRLRIDHELYARMVSYNDQVHDMATADGMNTVISFFLERGVKVVEGELSASGTGELF